MEKLTLGKKTLLIVSFFAFVIVSGVVSAGFFVFTQSNNNSYMLQAKHAVSTALLFIDADSIKQYKEQAEDNVPKDEIMDAKYYLMLQELKIIKDSNNLSFLYIVDVDYDRCLYIMDTSDDNTKIEVGRTQQTSMEDKNFLDEKQYEKDGFSRRSAKYGEMCSSAAPIKTESGETVAYIFAEHNMEQIQLERFFFMLRAVVVLCAFSSVVVFVSMKMIRIAIINPINGLSFAARGFVTEGDHESNQFPLSSLNINTGDEIENLYKSIMIMENDINEYIYNLQKVMAEKERIDAELSVASTIQTAMIPDDFKPESRLSLAAEVKPAKEVGGDFYDYMYLNEDHIAVIVADVSGKGVPAALFMVIAKTLIKNQLMSGLSPSNVFETVNNMLCERNKAEMFVTAWLGVLELSSGRLTYANAGHNPPLLKKQGKNYEYLRCRSGIMLGGITDMKYRQFECVLDIGDSLFLYTDGITEASNLNSELFGEKRLKDALSENNIEQCEQVLKYINTKIDDYVRSAEQYDDMTMLMLKIPGEYVEKTVNAEISEISSITDFVDDILIKNFCQKKVISTINIVIDEIMSNIIHYSKSDSLIVGCAVIENRVSLRFKDFGVPYDPTNSETPDITLPAIERKTGGLGIYMTKKLTDSFVYEYLDNCNISTIRKTFSKSFQ